MIKRVLAKDLRKGDVVTSDDNPHHFRGLFTITELDPSPFGAIRAREVGNPENARCCGFKPDDVFTVVHRPWEEGKTEDDMLNDVIVALMRTGCTRDREDLKKQLPALREAIEKYELGKPIDFANA